MKIGEHKKNAIYAAIGAFIWLYVASYIISLTLQTWAAFPSIIVGVLVTVGLAGIVVVELDKEDY